MHAPIGGIAMEREKRELRKLKRIIKRTGSKHRRREFKRQVSESPEEATYMEENFGRNSSASMNGLDRDATRRPHD
jgi:hypothetical protein